MINVTIFYFEIVNFPFLDSDGHRSTSYGVCISQLICFARVSCHVADLLRELVALLILSSWCLVIVDRLFLAVPRGCLRFVIVVFP